MSEPLRTDLSHAPGAAPGPDRDAKIEQLLLVGLDHYFAAQYEQAINVWTRALFLDRSHARARAYIDRARSALAERQRESEELLHTGLAAFNRGDGDEARRLLQAAMQQGAPSDEALAALDRLSRLEQGHAPQRPPAPLRPERTTVAPVDRQEHSRGWGLAVSAIAIALVAAAAFYVAAAPIDWRAPFGPEPRQTPPPSASATPDISLPIPLRGETALDRARGLQARGRLRDALSALDLVRPTDAQKTDADRLRAAIQQQLLSLTTVEAVTPPESGKGDGPLP
jgi:tetratricopeptide (TPR) repeat protein